MGPVAAIKHLVRDTLRRRHERLGVPKVEYHVPPVDLLDNPGHQIAFPAGVGGIDLLPLGHPQPLGDDLFGGLGGDPTELLGLLLPLPNHGAFFIEKLAEDAYVPRVGVDGHPRLVGLARGPFVGRHQGVGQGVQDGLDRHPSLSLQQFQGFHDLVVNLHQATFPFPGFGAACQRKTVRADRTAP